MQLGYLAPSRLDSPARCCCVIHRAGLLETAIEQLMIRQDFYSALESCEKGLLSLKTTDSREETCSRNGELKAAFCIVGVQALAELNRWREVLMWVLGQYGAMEHIPAKIMQLCILLHTKVSEQAAVQEAVRTWLVCPSNTNLSGYSSVAELYVLHVLLPLGQTIQAKQLLESELGQVAFTEDQRQTALAILESLDSNVEPLPNPNPERVPEKAGGAVTARGGSLIRKFSAITHLLYGCLSAARSTAWRRFISRTAVLLFLLYLLLVRLDAASSTALPLILRLHALLQQVWNAMFAPFYRASS